MNKKMEYRSNNTTHIQSFLAQLQSCKLSLQNQDTTSTKNLLGSNASLGSFRRTLLHPTNREEPYLHVPLISSYFEELHSLILAA